MYCGPPNQLPPCLLDMNWGQKRNPSGHFEQVLSSIVSSSSSQSSCSPASAGSVVFRKLMGGSKGIANSGDEMSPQPHHIEVRLNSPPRHDLSVTGHLYQHQQVVGGLPGSGNPTPLTHLDQFMADLGFAERVASFSGSDGRNCGELATATRLQIGLREGRKTIPVPGGLQLGINNGELLNAREESSTSDRASAEPSLGAPAGSNAKKRKVPPKGKGKDTTLANSAIDNISKVAEDEDCDAKRRRSMEKDGNQDDSGKPNGDQKQPKDGDTKPPEPRKDYIHVRARRGQATDSHSLAERVRREKISQRMKLLQDLVPGCNKVTGKAVMPDEIINYVQSLQQQVEFLSMKLATVNPQFDFNNLANLLSKDMGQSCAPIPNSLNSLQTSEMTQPHVNQAQQGTSLHCVLPNVMETESSVNLLHPTFHQNFNTQQLFLSGIESASSQLGTFWEDGNVVHMDIGQN